MILECKQGHRRTLGIALRLELPGEHELDVYLRKPLLQPPEPGQVALGVVEFHVDLVDPVGLIVPILRDFQPAEVELLTQLGVSADTALRLSRHFGNSAEFWLGLQMDYDLGTIRLESGRKIEAVVQRRAP